VYYECRATPLGYALGGMHDHACELEKLLTISRRSCEVLQRELEELRKWKESALSVTPPLQDIGRALGLTLGASIHDKILSGIQALQALQSAQSELTERLNQRVIDFNEADKARIKRIQELDAQLSNQS